MTDAATTDVDSRTDARKAFGLAHGYAPFQCVLADPPWSYSATNPPIRSDQVEGRKGVYQSIGYYYGTMTTDQIKALPVADVVAKDAVLFLWATVPLMPDAFAVMEAWGFEYKTMLTWYKTNCKGMGYWFRGYTEHLLLGVRGDVKAFRSLQRNVVECKVGKHSSKPEQFYELIEGVTTGPRLEMFARRARPGWTAFGNQVEHDLLSA